MYQPVTIQTLSDDEQWVDTYCCHAQVNGLSGSAYWAARAQQAQTVVEFRTRYSKALAGLKPQTCRIVFAGKPYDVEHIDDYKFQHQNLTFKAVCNE